MVSSSSERTRALVVGANHRSSSLAVRDRLFVDDSRVDRFLQGLRRSGVEQALLLSTCDRVEIQAVDGTGGDASVITEAFSRHAGLDARALDGQIYVLRDEDALHHIFRVTASLDSLVVGEPQVLGQVKASHRRARDLGMCGGGLEAILQAAYGAAKRVRTETGVGERPVSIAAAAVRIAHDVHGDLGGCAGLLLGVGDMGILVARQLKGAGLGQLTVVHPDDGRADAVARELDCHTAPFARLDHVLAGADVAVTALGGRRHAVDAGMAARALVRRRNKPVFLVDTAIPGDVEPAVHDLDGVFLFDVGDLERVAMEGRARREAEAERALAIIDAAVADFLSGRAERRVGPVLADLRLEFETRRDEALAEAGDDAAEATRLLINRILHTPSRVMREIARTTARSGRAATDATDATDADRLLDAERLLVRLFDLRAGVDGGRSRENEE